MNKLLFLMFSVFAMSVDAETTTSPKDSLVSNRPKVDISQQMKPEIGHSDQRIKDAQEGYAPGISTTGGDFRITCHSSHMNNDDPIVYPSQQGAAHHHTYFGNTTTDYTSTPDDLKLSGNSTCFGGIANRSAYWVPSLIDTTQDKPIRPDWALFYYKGGDITPPNGLVIIAGDHTGWYRTNHGIVIWIHKISDGLSALYTLSRHPFGFHNAV